MIDANKVVDALTPQLARLLVDNIKNKVDNIDLGTQSADTSVGYQYSVNQSGGTIQINIGSGNISGTQTVDVSEHSRGVSQVSAHKRTYEDKRVFELPNGKYLTSETIPDAIIDMAVSAALEELTFGDR